MKVNLNDLFLMDRKFKEAHNFGFLHHALALSASGSHAYNLDTPTSDLDYVGVCFPPFEYILGFRDWDSWHPKKDHFGFSSSGKELDFKVFSFKRFVQLLLNANPSMLEILWAPDDVFFYRHPEFIELQEARTIFNSKLVVKSLIGYAKNQLKRMTCVGNDEKSTRKQGNKRKKLIEKYGYDPKNASHVIRLLKMGVEFAKTQELRPWRTEDRNDLIQIKQGDWSLEGIIEYAEDLLVSIQNINLDELSLPATPDYHEANALVTKITKNRIILQG